MSDLDVLLRESLGRLAEPGDPTGVVEAVRARVEAAGSLGGNSAGDGGSGATGAGGGGSAGSGFWGGWAPLAILAAVGLVGGVIVGVATQSDAGSTSAYAPLSLPGEFGVPAALCPGGETVALLDPGARLVAVARTEDGESVAVRNPRALDSLVWIALSAAEPDADADIDALPVSGCEESGPIVPIVTAEPEPAPAPEPEPQPGPNPGPQPGPQPPADHQNPTIQIGNWSESYVNGPASCPTPPKSATITVFASDDVGVVSVTGVSTNAQAAVSGPSVSGNAYTFTVTYSGSADSSTVLNFTVKDAANKTAVGSSPALSVLACFG